MSKLDYLKEKFDSIATDMEVYFQEVSSLIRREDKLKEDEQSLRQREGVIDDKHRGLVTEEKRLKEQSDYIARQLASLSKLDDKLEIIKEKTLYLDNREAKLLEEEAVVDAKIKVLTELESRREELEQKTSELSHDQSLVEKEKAVDRQRKKLLDLRENKIKTREIQLQIESDAI